MRTAAWMRTLMLVAAFAPPLALAGGTVHAQPKGAKPGAASEAAAVKKAVAFMTKGQDLFKLKKFALALDQFKQSYATVPSPNSHLLMARCIAALGDARAAYIEFTKVIEEASARGEKYAAAGDAARSEREELVSKLALVTVSVAPQAGPNASVRIGAEIIPREQWDKPIPFAPGTVEATLQIEGRPDVTQTLTLAGGEKKSVALNPAAIDTTAPPPGAAASSESSPTAPTPSKQSPLRPAAYIAGGVGVVGMGIFAVTGALTLSTFSNLQETCGGPCPPNRADEVNSGKTTQAVANVSLVIGAVGLAAGATLFVLSLRKDKTESAPSAPAAARLVVSPGYAGLHGEF
jgi:hypothetical protein